MNKKVPEITESVEDLKGLLRQAKKKHEIQRLNVLYLLRADRQRTGSKSRSTSVLIARVSGPGWRHTKPAVLGNSLSVGMLPDELRYSLSNSKMSCAKPLRT